MKSLRLRLTLFNTAITGAVLVSLTVLCLFASERNMKDNAFQSFQNNMNRVCNYLDEEDQVKLSWLRQMEETDGTIISIQDQGRALFSAGFYNNQENAAQNFQKAFAMAHDQPVRVDEQLHFTMSGTEYFYTGYSRISKGEGELEVVLLYPLTTLEHGIARQRFIVCVGVVAALQLLVLFSWSFTGKMLRPIQENQRRQAEFVAAASHELRTPLAGILSAAGAMEKAEAKDRQHFYSMIQQEGQRMTRLIGDMLTLASGDSGNWDMALKPTELDMLLLSTYEIFSSRVKEKGLKLRISLPEDEVPVMQLDPERLEQVLAVLLDNAMAYTPAPGTIELSLSVLGNKVRIAVEDSGPGVPDAEKKSIFHRFHRSEKARSDPGHFGLGLSIASEIVGRLGGSIWVEDSALGGAAFILEFSNHKKLP